MIIIVEGPEKAGKTTFINALEQRLIGEGYQVERRKLAADDEDDRRYTPMLQEDVRKLNKVVIWDRGWVSEYVYATLLKRPRRAAYNPWLMEWIHSRAVRPNGVLFTIMPKNLDELYKRRDSTDLPVDPWLEALLFIQHSVRYNWQILGHSYTDSSLRKIVDMAMETIRKVPLVGPEYLPPNYAGPVSTPENRGILIVAHSSEEAAYPGAWLPGSGEIWAKLAAILDPYASLAAWTTFENLTERMIRSAEVLITISPEVSSEVMDKLPRARAGKKLPRLWEINPAWISGGVEIAQTKRIINALRQNRWKRHAPVN